MEASLPAALACRMDRIRRVRPALSRSRRRIAPARLGIVVAAIAGAVAFAGCDVSEDADLDRGRALFQQNCGTCHTLAQAGTGADIGPDLDAAFAQARADGMDNDTIEGVVQTQIESPRATDEGVRDYGRVFMPAELVTGQDAEDVATYVASVAGVPGAKPPELASPALFAEKCGICHTLSEAGTTSTTGPDLDQALAGKDATFIHESIVNPDAEIAQGFSAGTMPRDFETTLTEKDLQGLVDYLLKSVAAGGGGAG
jgi:mono/diheme cytochrome c family protein